MKCYHVFRGCEYMHVFLNKKLSGSVGALVTTPIRMVNVSG